MVMTRDLIRLVLSAAEAQTARTPTELHVNNGPIPADSDLDEAARYCVDRGYIELWAKPDLFGGGTKWMVKRMTADGHDKLRELRGEDPL